MDPPELGSEPAPGYARRGEIQASHLTHDYELIQDLRPNEVDHEQENPADPLGYPNQAGSTYGHHERSTIILLTVLSDLAHQILDTLSAQSPHRRVRPSPGGCSKLIPSYPSYLLTSNLRFSDKCKVISVLTHSTPYACTR